MNHDELEAGVEYIVDAVGTDSLERWTITKIYQNKYEQWEVEAKGTKTAHRRVFTPDQFKETTQTKKKKSKQIISESVELLATFEGGVEMWREHTTFWPAQAKRGRKKTVAA